MPRQDASERPTPWKIQVPLQVALQIDNICINPVTHRPAYGWRSQLVTALLREWLAKNEIYSLADSVTKDIILPPGVDPITSETE